ncbi:MAG: ribosome maturation factor RimM [Actinomycetota bacterium]
MTPEPTVVVGRIAKAHGVRGEVAVEIRSDNPDRFVEGATVFTPDGRGLTMERVHAHGQRTLVTFAGIRDRTAAEALTGTLLEIPQSWLPALAPGEYWPFELEGCAMTTEAGRSLGTVSEVIPNPANDLWVATDEDGVETLVPALRDVIVEVDVTAKRILVRDIPGLTIPEDD